MAIFENSAVAEVFLAGNTRCTSSPVPVRELRIRIAITLTYHLAKKSARREASTSKYSKPVNPITRDPD